MKIQVGYQSAIEHEPFDYPETEAQPKKTIPESRKISSKKPHFLHVTYSRLAQVKQVRVKLWKLKSCLMKSFEDQEFRSIIARVQQDIFDDKKVFGMYLNPTMKASLKTVRRLTIRPILRKDVTLYQLAPPSLKLLSSLAIYVKGSMISSDQFHQARLTSRLKKCTVETDIKAAEPATLAHWRLELMNFISKFRKCHDCQLLIGYHFDGPKILFNTNRLVSDGKFSKQAQELWANSTIASKILLNSPEAIEAASFQNAMMPTHLPELPNLKQLKILKHSSPNTQEEENELTQYSKLESLFVQFGGAMPPKFGHFACMKDLSLSFLHGEVPSEFFEKIPEIESLERFNIQIQNSKFDGNQLGDVIKRIKNLKTLGFQGTIQDIYSIINNDMTLGIDQLSILICNQATGNKDAIKGVANFIQRHPNLKSLYLSFEICHSTVNDVILKAAAKLDSLVALKLRFVIQTELEVNILKEVKNVLLKNPNLKAFCIDTQNVPISARDLSGFADGLLKLKNLQKFDINAAFHTPTEASFGKFSRFIESVCKIKSLRVNIRGCSDEQLDYLNKIIRKDSCLSG